MARSIDPPSSRRNRRPGKQQRGDALIEAMVAMVLLGVIGLGLVYAVGRAMAAQKFQKGQSLAIQAIRADLQGSGIANSCPTSGNATVTSTLTLGTNLTLPDLQKTCTVTAVTVTINGVAKSTSLPIVRFAVAADTLLGPGTLTVTN